MEKKEQFDKEKLIQEYVELAGEEPKKNWTPLVISNQIKKLKKEQKLEEQDKLVNDALNEDSSKDYLENEVKGLIAQMKEMQKEKKQMQEEIKDLISSGGKVNKVDGKKVNINSKIKLKFKVKELMGRIIKSAVMTSNLSVMGANGMPVTDQRYKINFIDGGIEENVTIELMKTIQTRGNEIDGTGFEAKRLFYKKHGEEIEVSAKLESDGEGGLFTKLDVPLVYFVSNGKQYYEDESYPENFSITKTEPAELFAELDINGETHTISTKYLN